MVVQKPKPPNYLYARAFLYFGKAEQAIQSKICPNQKHKYISLLLAISPFMDDFVVSARKYRPKTFESVVGQESITNTLLKAIESHHLAQAFLFCGPRGVGKTTCARILARIVNEFNQTEGSEENDFSFNIFELDAASNNSVEDIRNLIEQVRIPPQTGKYKVYIIDEVHMLSTSAFNAFLKTLEEPPPYAIFILATTEKHKVLPTILSRCQIFDFNRIQIPDMVSHLAGIATKEGIEVGGDALHIIAEKADGALRDALSIFDQVVGFAGNKVTYQDVITNLNILDYDYYFSITDAFLKGDKSESLVIFNQILSAGFDGHNFVNGLANHFRNLLFCTSEKTASIMEVGENIKVKYLEQAKACDPRFMLNALNILSETDINYKPSKNQRLLVEIALLKLCALADRLGEKKNDNNSVTEQETPPQPEQISATPPLPPVAPEVVATPVQKVEPAVPKPQPEPIQLPKVEEVVELIEAPAPQPETSTPASIDAGPAVNSVAEPAKKTTSYSGKLKGLKSRGLPSLSEIGEEKKQKPKIVEVLDEDGNTVESESFDGMPATDFTMADLWKVWDQYANRIKAEDKQSYYVTLTQHKPILKENFQIELKIHNHVQQSDIDSDRSNLLEFLRESLQNWRIQFKAVIDEEDLNDGVSLYDPYKKYEAMIKDNPALATMKDKLDLDIDYDG